MSSPIGIAWGRGETFAALSLPSARHSLSPERALMARVLQEIMALVYSLQKPWQVKVWSWKQHFYQCPVNYICSTHTSSHSNTALRLIYISLSSKMPPPQPLALSPQHSFSLTLMLPVACLPHWLWFSDSENVLLERKLWHHDTFRGINNNKFIYIALFKSKLQSALQRHKSKINYKMNYKSRIDTVIITSKASVTKGQ